MNHEQQVANAVARFFRGVDERDWRGLRARMTHPFHVDYASFGRGAPADVDPMVVLDGWAEFLPRFEHTHHQLGNMDIEVSGSEATVHCAVTGTHVAQEEVWTVVGAYDLRLERNDDQWKLARLRFDYRYQTGTPPVD